MNKYKSIKDPFERAKKIEKDCETFEGWIEFGFAYFGDKWKRDDGGYISEGYPAEKLLQTRIESFAETGVERYGLSIDEARARAAAAIAKQDYIPEIRGNDIA